MSARRLEGLATSEIAVAMGLEARQAWRLSLAEVSWRAAVRVCADTPHWESRRVARMGTRSSSRTKIPIKAPISREADGPILEGF